MNSEFQVIVFGPIHKNYNSDFFMTRGIMLGSENSEVRVIFFCPAIMLGSENSEFQVIILALY